MGRDARWVIGVLSVSSSLLWIWLPTSGLIPQNDWICYVLAGVFLVVGGACLPGRLGLRIGRFGAGLAFLICLGYLGISLVDPEPYRGRASAHPVNALRLFLAFGLPCGAFALFGGELERRRMEE